MTIVKWEYSPDTGQILRNGVPNGTLRKDGYIVCWYNGRLEYAHKLAYILQGLEPPEMVDHANGVRSDNRWVNLRRATNMLNQYNRRGVSKQGYKKGAYYNKQAKVWYSLIRYDGKREYLGHFPSEDAAHAAYIKRSKEVHGEYACTGRALAEGR